MKKNIEKMVLALSFVMLSPFENVDAKKKTEEIAEQGKLGRAWNKVKSVFQDQIEINMKRLQKEHDYFITKINDIIYRIKDFRSPSYTKSKLEEDAEKNISTARSIVETENKQAELTKKIYFSHLIQDYLNFQALNNDKKSLLTENKMKEQLDLILSDTPMAGLQTPENKKGFWTFLGKGRGHDRKFNEKLKELSEKQMKLMVDAQIEREKRLPAGAGVPETAGQAGQTGQAGQAGQTGPQPAQK